jgi:hypothetical protein
MALSSSNAKNVAGGSQNPPAQDNDRLCINMVNSLVNLATQSRNYNSPQTVPGLESPPPQEMPLQIKKLRATTSYFEKSTQALYPQSKC